jgi:hypothetical protein
MGQYTADQLGFIDEVSKDERTPGCSQGRSKKGTRAKRRQVFVRGQRLSATGLLTIDGIIASVVVEGSMTMELLSKFLEESIVRIGFFRSPAISHQL